MKKVITCLLIMLAFVACKKTIKEEQTKEKETTEQKVTIKPVYASVETTQVSSTDDAADDACIWIHPEKVMESKIIATNKQEGLVVYDLSGKQVYQYPIGRVNNVDVRGGFVLKNDTVAIVTASNRTSNTISIHKVNLDGTLTDVAAKPLKSELPEVYGLGMYKSPKNHKIYVIINGKEGNVEQWELFEKEGKVAGKIVRKFAVGSQTEGVVADDFHGVLYIGEEEKALWKYNAEPDASEERKRIAKTTDVNMQADFEGVTIYDKGAGKGYVLLSSQGNNSYAVFDRESNIYLGSFSIENGKEIDGTYDTDGIDASSVSFGDQFPKGFFIAQDGANTKKKDSLNQNFKLVDWRAIENSLNLK